MGDVRCDDTADDDWEDDSAVADSAADDAAEEASEEVGDGNDAVVVDDDVLLDAGDTVPLGDPGDSFDDETRRGRGEASFDDM